MKNKTKLILGSGMTALLLIFGYIAFLIIDYRRQSFLPDQIKVEKYIKQEARKLKNTQERIQALYSKDYLIRSAGLQSLAEHPDPVATIPIIEFYKDKNRTADVKFAGNNTKNCGDEILLNIGTSTIPFIINEIKLIINQVPNEDWWFVYVLQDTLIEFTSLQKQYLELMSVEDKKLALQWWIDWWEQSKNIPQSFWRKEAIKVGKNRLISTNYVIRIDAIKELRRLTGLTYSQVIIGTPAEEYPPIKGRKDFKGYPTAEDIKKWQEWFDKHGEIDKWQKWIDENYDYLYWSKAKGRFMVNEDAKSKGNPVDPETGQIILK